jgi:uncharacterized protein YbjQ (UPF0145 family)
MFDDCLCVTTPGIPGYEIIESKGLVKGSSVRAKWIGADIIAGIKNIFGGEISEYSRLLDDTREQSRKRMIVEAERMGANAIVNIRYATSQIGQQAAEILTYGTAVLAKKKDT